MKASLPVLENLRVASPCTESWDAMTGDERARHCASCDKDVFNLSGMTRDEATAFVRAKIGASDDVCVRLYKRRDGTVLTADCPVGIARARRRMFLVAASVFSFLGLGAIAAAATSRASQCDLGGDGSFFGSSPTVQAVVAMFQGQPPPPPVTTKIMGKMVYRPPVTPAVTPVANNGGTP